LGIDALASRSDVGFIAGRRPRSTVCWNTRGTQRSVRAHRIQGSCPLVHPRRIERSAGLFDSCRCEPLGLVWIAEVPGFVVKDAGTPWLASILGSARQSWHRQGREGWQCHYDHWPNRPGERRCRWTETAARLCIVVVTGAVAAVAVGCSGEWEIELEGQKGERERVKNGC
jgi:hypothetical protein